MNLNLLCLAAASHPAVRAAMLLCLFGSAASAEEQPAKDSRTDMIERAIRLHDQGAYEAAIRIYRDLLEAEPGDRLVHYELAMTHKAQEDYENCIVHATRATEGESNLQAASFSMLASCQDDGGQSQEALKTFARALELHPEDVMLNFNHGITLAREGEAKRSRAAFATAIRQAPAYPSPYFAYADVLYNEQQALTSSLMFLRFLMAEPHSARSIKASKLALEPFAMEPREGEDRQRITIRLPPASDREDEDEDEFMALNLGVSLGISAHAVDEKVAQLPPAERAIANTRFALAVANETADDQLKATFIWTTAVQPLQELERTGMLLPFLYHVADLAELEGARAWLDANPKQIDQLARTLGEFQDGMKRSSK